jgi:hypothetical protein
MNTNRTAMSDRISRVFWAFFVFVTFVAALILLNISKPSVLEIDERVAGEEVRLNSSPTNARYFTAGYGSFVSVSPWVSAISNYANVMFDGDSGIGLPSRLLLASDLDSLWFYPLYFAALITPDLPGCNSADALPFLIRGTEKFPEKWQFRITWAQYVLAEKKDTLKARDSAAKVLLPLSRMSGEIPDYARNLAFTLMNKNGEQTQAMDVLVQNYRAVPDAFVRLSLQRKLADLLWRNQVSLDSDSAAFISGICSMLDSDSIQSRAANVLLIRLVQSETKTAALFEARQLARQFRDFQTAKVDAIR